MIHRWTAPAARPPEPTPNTGVSRDASGWNCGTRSTEWEFDGQHRRTLRRTFRSRAGGVREQLCRTRRRRRQFRGDTRRGIRGRSVGRLSGCRPLPPLAGTHDHQRVLHHQDHDLSVRPPAGRSGPARSECAGRPLLAGVCRKRQRQRAGQAFPQSLRRTARFQPAAHRGGTLRLGSVLCRSRRSVLLVAARHPERLPRDHPGLSHRRGRATDHRQNHRHLFS